LLRVFVLNGDVRLRFPKVPSLPKLADLPKLPSHVLSYKEWEGMLKDWEVLLLGGGSPHGRKLPVMLIAGAVIVVVCLLEVGRVSFFQKVEWMTYDARVKLTGHHAGPNPDMATNLGLVEITDETIAMVNNGTLGYRYGLYWPRSVYARGLQELSQQGAAAVGFDVDFDSRRPGDPGAKLADGKEEGSDEFFADVIKKSGIAILGAEHHLLPDPLFQESALDVGNIGADADEDGVLRRDQPYEVYRIWDPFIAQIALEWHLDLDEAKVEFDSQAFEAGDISDLQSFAARLTGQADAVSTFLRDRLDKTTTGALLQYKRSETGSNELAGRLIKALNKIVAGPSIYQDARFAAVKLRPEAFRLLDRNLRDGGMARFNRVLLEDAYPMELTRNEAAKITLVRKREGSSKFTLGEKFEVAPLADILTRQAGALAAFLSGQLDAKAQGALRAYQGSKTNEEELGALLVDNFNRIIAGPALYDPDRFRNVVLRPETDKLRKSNPKGGDLARLNRMLLEDACPEELTLIIRRDKEGFTDTKTITSTAPAGKAKFIPYSYRQVWSMGIVLAAGSDLKLDLDKTEIRPEHHQVVLHGEKGVSRVIPLQPDGSYYVDWEVSLKDSSIQGGAPGTSPPLQAGTLEEFLQEAIERASGTPPANAWWKNRLVMVGSAATALPDIGQTPLERSTILVYKHLNVANMILTNRFVTTSPLTLKLLLIAVMGAIAGWVTSAVARPLAGTALMAAVVVVYVGLACWLYAAHRFWLPVVLPLGCSGLVTHAMALTYRVQAEQAEKKRVKSVFSKMLAPEVVEELLGLGQLEMGGVRREITVYFADVRGFTALTDKMQIQATEYAEKHKLTPEQAEAHHNQLAKETLEMVSTYLGTIAGAIKKHNGTLDKYIGDCAMAFWGGPLSNPRHACDAVRSAIDAQRAMLELNLKRDAENKRIEAESAARAAQGLPPETPLPVLSMGTGINTGTAIMGLMGSKEDGLSYTVFGREVNLASRLEGLSGYGRIIISHATYLALQRDAPELAALCVEQIPADLKGFRQAVRNYEVRWRVEGGPEDPTQRQMPQMSGSGTGTFLR
jgi:class 3 adenylate cyclase/CHASE2 domain-containing sensor protein